MRRIGFVIFGLICLAPPSPAVAQQGRRVEVIEVKGIIDGPVEHAVLATIEGAEQDDAALVVLQIDSKGVVDAERVSRLVDAVARASVPVVGWVGPAGARAENAAVAIALSAHLTAMAPGASIGPFETFDLRGREETWATTTGEPTDAAERAIGVDQRLGADRAEEEGVIDVVAPAIFELLEEIDGEEIEMADGEARLGTDPDEITVRFHKPDLFGRVLHAAAQPSITYLLVLLALVGIVFELFHPSTGPAGISGLVAMALAVYGIVTLGGSWFGFALIVGGIAAFCVDLRFASLGAFSVGGLVALTTGSLLLFRSPWLRVSPWVLAIGIIGMVFFLVGAMTRVLRDLRAIARGELEVTDAHPHPNGQGGDDDA